MAFLSDLKRVVIDFADGRELPITLEWMWHISLPKWVKKVLRDHEGSGPIWPWKTALKLTYEDEDRTRRAYIVQGCYSFDLEVSSTSLVTFIYGNKASPGFFRTDFGCYDDGTKFVCRLIKGKHD